MIFMFFVDKIFFFYRIFFRVLLFRFARQRQEVEDHLIRKQQEREEKYEAFCEKLGKTRDNRFDQMQSKANLARDTRVKAFSSAQSNHKIIQEQKDEKWAGPKNGYLLVFAQIS